jgi:MFS transporter, DHA2 family, glioxin efflux transporter
MLIKLPGFYINIPIGAVAAVIIALSFKAPETAKFARINFKERLYHFDILGILTIMASVVCFVLALQKAGVTFPWRSSMVIGLLIGSILLFIVFCGIQD